MCGIAGELRFDRRVSDLTVTKDMCDAQIHRGPDDEGYYASGPVSLGIRRLAIIDLSKGLYPLRNEEGTIHLVFNGEIYGFQSLRMELERSGHRFRSKTDAEILIHGYEEWNTACLEQLDGMFAFALWDEPKQLLWIARDQFGIKPVYYYRNERFLTFASEIKPLYRHPGIPCKPNERFARQYLHTGATADSTEETFFEGMNRLAPAHQLLIRPSGVVERKRYWSPAISKRIDGKISSEEIERTGRSFLEAIDQELVSDVPVGTCLSGGIDSSAVVCAIKKVHPDGTASTGRMIKTFSAVFPGEVVDETTYAVEVCRSTGAEQNLVMPTSEEFWRDLPALVKCQEEPFGSSSVYAQWRVMKLAKERGVTVLLDGQGGDELLAGYLPYYIYYLQTLRSHGKYLRVLIEGLLSIDLTGPFIKSYLRDHLTRRIADWTKAILGDAPRESFRLCKAPHNDIASKLEIDTCIMTLPALLRYEDKNSMCHSIEARVPYLHKSFFEYVASLPLNRKLSNGWTKRIFRLAMKGILPDRIRVRRNKIGFETPQKKWIEKELRTKLRGFFSQPDLAATKYYNLRVLKGLLDKPTLTTEETNIIWRILNLEMWHREFIRDRTLGAKAST
jgi:asparagine synthase (glutamine-hydrolysing)